MCTEQTEHKKKMQGGTEPDADENRRTEIMSLVDYASSDSDDVPENDVPVEEEQEEALTAESHPSPSFLPPRKPSPSSKNLSENAQELPPLYFEKLPDASLLLNSSTGSSLLNSGSDHVSRVAAAMAESASRKRDSQILSSTAPRNKVPRGTLPRTKSVPDTVGGVLTPPQLRGRSNVVTEDLGKLFVKRHTEPSSR